MHYSAVVLIILEGNIYNKASADQRDRKRLKTGKFLIIAEEKLVDATSINLDNYSILQTLTREK